MISAMVCLLGVSAMATETSYVRVKLRSASNTYSVVRLTEDDAYTSAYEDGADTDKMMSFANSKSILLYALVGTHNCEDVVANNVDNLWIGFTTNTVDADYYISFDQMTPTSREMKLYDALLDSVIVISNTTPEYHFTATAGRVAVTDRFMVGEPAPVAYEICHRYNALQVSGYKGGTVVVKDNTDATVISVVVPTRTQHTIDLSALAAGQYKVEANGQTLIIDVK